MPAPRLNHTKNTAHRIILCCRRMQAACKVTFAFEYPINGVFLHITRIFYEAYRPFKYCHCDYGLLIIETLPHALFASCHLFKGNP